ncbi:MAG: ribosome biogenesis GTP-binding protein YihA/YsxC [Porticoccaceae bacterium]|jgi:GTP-binding protein
MTEPVNFALAEFLKSAPTLQHCPADEGAEIAFAGRSNAGKSSAINCLTGQSKLARTSKTPGRTQLLNFFTLSTSQRIVDLPGYGFAKVPIAMKKEWDRNLANYLQNRKSLKALVLLMDIRHPLQEYDWQMIQWAHQCNLPMHLLLTKADKLKNGPAKATQLSVAQQVRQKGIANISVQTFSSLKKTGLDELKKFLNQHLAVTGQ